MHSKISTNTQTVERTTRIYTKVVIEWARHIGWRLRESGWINCVGRFRFVKQLRRVASDSMSVVFVCVCMYVSNTSTSHNGEWIYSRGRTSLREQRSHGKFTRGATCTMCAHSWLDRRIPPTLRNFSFFLASHYWLALSTSVMFVFQSDVAENTRDSFASNYFSR